MMKKVLFLALCVSTACTDIDQDGYPKNRDCDDSNGFVFPGQTEVCDGIDNDCDGFVDEGVSIQAYWDRDGDGFGDDSFVRRVCVLPDDGVLQGGDCDDLDVETHPDATETCDGRDNNCDQQIDENVLLPFFEDLDGDGHGVPDTEVLACEPGFGASALDDDCDDTDPFNAPSLSERCDEKDNNCDGIADEDLPLKRQWVDSDGDGAGDPERPILACGPITGVADNPNDCDDTNPDIGPQADEIRGNAVDEDCDGYLNELAIPDEFATLEDALEAATEGDVVQLGFGTFIELVDLRGRKITLAGEGCTDTVLYGDSQDTIVRMDGGRLEQLTLSSGSAENGGGLQITGDSWVSDVCIENNEAINGGGLAVLSGVATLKDVHFEKNQAQYGGAIHVAPLAEVHLVRGQFYSNAAARYGGGVYASDAIVWLENTVMAQNRAEQHGGAFYLYNQGPEYDTDGTLLNEHVETPVLHIEQSTLYGNWAKVLGQAGYNYRGELELVRSILSDHQAEGSYNAQLLYEYYPEREAFSELILWNNEGSDRRMQFLSDVYRVNPSFQSPHTHDFRLSPYSPLIGILPDTNNPDSSPGDPGAYGGPNAGVDFNHPYAADADNDGLPDGFEWNNALNPWIDDAEQDPDGDGLSNRKEFELGTNPTVIDTDTDGISDGVEASEGTSPLDPRDNIPVCHIQGHHWVVTGETLLVDGSLSADPKGLPLVNTWTIDGPLGTSISTVDTPTATTARIVPDVPGLWVLTLSLDNGTAARECSFEFNATSGWVVPDDFDTIQEALNIATNGDTIAIRPGVYSETLDTNGVDVQLVGLGHPNEVLITGEETQASVVHIGATEDVFLQQLTLSKGHAENGGGVYIGPGASVTLRDMILHDNHSENCGGGLYAEGATVSIQDTKISQNSATKCGGGIAVDNAPLVATRVQIWNNEALESGGGIALLSGSKQVFHNTWIQDNYAPMGAAVSRDASSSFPAEFWNSAFLSNRGASSPILNEDGSLSIIASRFSFNDGSSTVDAEIGAITSLLHNRSSKSGTLPDQAANQIGPLSFAVWSNDANAANDFLAPSNTALEIDAGYPWHIDVDGSVADIGLFGGPFASPLSPLFRIDSDSDGMSNGWEAVTGLNPNSNDAAADSDSDGLTNAEEHTYSTDPLNDDTDGDGVSDGDEKGAGTNPNDPSDNQPIAHADVVPRTRTNTALSLDGSASTDPNGDTLTFQWTLNRTPSKSTQTQADIANATSKLATFTPDSRGLYQLTLVVSDGQSDSRPYRFTIEVYGDLFVPSEYGTIEDAVAALIEDDTIVLEAGTHVGHIDSPGIRFNVSGAGQEDTEWYPTVGQPAIALNNSEQVTITDLTIRDGMGSYGGAIECYSSSSATTLTTVVLERVQLSQNIGDYGGAVRLRRCKGTFTDVHMDENGAGMSGGALYIDESELLWVRGTVSRNHANATGGALYLRNSDTKLNNIIVVHNASTGSGGAIYQYGGSLDVSFSAFDYNDGFSGTIVAQSATSLEVSHSMVLHSNNYGIYAGSVTTSNSEFTLFDGNLSGDAYPSALSSSTTNVFDSPHFVTAPSLLNTNWDLRLRSTSVAIDAGDTSLSDPDGTIADIGAYGGPDTAMDYDRHYKDTDADGMSDGWEVENGLDPTVNDATGDLDGDGITNVDEYTLGTYANVTDSDSDGVSDDEEQDESTDPSDASDNRPTANAGPDKLGSISTTTALSGTGTDPNGDALTYQWSFESIPGRSTLTDTNLSGRTTKTPSFTPDSPGTYRIKLTVSDGIIDSAPDYAKVQVPGDLFVPEDYSTIAEAVESIYTGYSITIGTGVFDGSVDLNGKDIHFKGNGPENTELSGTGTKPIIMAKKSEDVELSDLTLSYGFAPYGGAVYVSSGTATLVNVTLEHNSAVNGGAIYMRFGALSMDRCRLTDNIVHGNGGAVYLYDSVMTVTQSLIAGNESVSKDGGAIYSVASTIDLLNVVLSQNSATKGGAIYLTGSSTTASTLEMSHVTATLNDARYGGIVRSVYGDISIQNSILSDTLGGYGLHASNTTTTTFSQTYSLVYDNLTSTYFNLTDPTGISGNISSDPMLTALSDDENWTNDDWILQATSPAIDAGMGPLDVDETSPDMGAFGGPEGDWTP